MQDLMAVESKAERLRRQLVGPGPVLALGAPDALSAKLAKEAEFDAIWASGFGISAASALPRMTMCSL